jgi:hypothetical protein
LYGKFNESNKRLAICINFKRHSIFSFALFVLVMKYYHLLFGRAKASVFLSESMLDFSFQQRNK